MQSGWIHRSPAPILQFVRRYSRRLSRWPAVGLVRFGSFRRVTPISREFGLDRGQCIDRYYIETFLLRYAADICGRVLEVGDDSYTRKFGGSRVSRSDVLNLRSGDPKTTLVGDLTNAQHITSEAFDCIVFTQTLQFIYDVRAALGHLHRILRPGGVLLATSAGISQISRYDMERWGDYWRFTTLSMRRIFDECFPGATIEVQAYGNVLAVIAFLEGLSAAELRREELDHRDPDYELLITVRAVKSGRVS
jgi:SAM-dependent methyltransferase